MDLAQEILINKYGQGLVDIEILIADYASLDADGKNRYLTHLVMLIIQSKSVNTDIMPAIENSHLKKTYTPCVLLEKGGTQYCSLKKIIGLPTYEFDKVLILLLNLFRIAYYRRFQKERNNPDKWWYWDLSDEKKMANVYKLFNSLGAEKNI